MDMAIELIENFIDWAKKKGWIIERAETAMELPEEVTTRYKNIPKQWLEFIIGFVDIMNSTDTLYYKLL